MSLIFNITAQQQGGRRPYPISRIEFPNSVDVVPSLDTVIDDDKEGPEKLAAFMAAQMKFYLMRFAGYAYFNSFIKEGSIGAEIGVDMGDGIDRCLLMKPKLIHAVDPWAPWDDPWSADQEEMDKRYRVTCDRFGGHASVLIHRMPSAEFYRKQEPSSIDWIYVDADHNENAVYEDLEGSYHLLKVGGVLAGDDLHDGKWGEGIGKAIYRFRKAHQGEIEVVWERSDPYILRKIK